MINDRLRNKVDSNGERFYFSVAEEVPLYRKDHKNLIGCIDNVAIHIGANRKKYIALFEVKSNEKWRSKAHKQLNKAEAYIEKKLAGTNIDYKIYKFHVYGYRGGYKLEWYRTLKK